jgi:HSP20 family molecular chaperone IbpA
LPENLDLETIKAVLEKWILYITIKKIKFSSQTIKVEARI